MHGEALSETIDAWIALIKEDDCIEIEIEERLMGTSGETLTLVADDNPWEEKRQEVAVCPPLDGKTRVLFFGSGYDKEQNLFYTYFNTQTSLGDDIDISDQHRIRLWIGTVEDQEAITAVRDRYENAIQDGIWHHLISVDNLMKSLSPTTSLGSSIAKAIGAINRRMT